jgi:hypothetical protein
MKIQHPLRKIALLAVAGIAGLVAFEAHAVWQADGRTVDILAAALAKPQPLGVEQLSARQIDVLLAVEDPAFHDHGGIDVASPGQGMTTITQALVKFLYFDPFEPGFAKIEQSLIAWLVLDRHLDKQQQLALFLNQAYFGTRDGTDILARTSHTPCALRRLKMAPGQESGAGRTGSTAKPLDAAWHHFQPALRVALRRPPTGTGRSTV